MAARKTAKKTAKKASAKKSAGKNGSKANQIFVFVGTDEGQIKEQALKKVRELEAKVGGEFALEQLAGIAENAQDASEKCQQTRQALLTMPFLGEGKVVWLKGVNFLADNQIGRAEAAQEGFSKLVETLETLPTEVFFVLSGGKPDKRRAAWKSLDKLTNVAYLDLPDASRDGWQVQVAAYARNRAEELGFQFQRDALELFVHLAGENTQTVNHELEKLSLSLEQGEQADADIVRELVINSRAGVIFELGDALGQRHLRRALNVLHHFDERQENPVGLLLAAIVPKMRNLLLIKDLMQSYRLRASSYPSFQQLLGNLPERATAHLPRAKSTGKLSAYPLFLCLREAENFSLSELRLGLSDCLEANRKLVNTAQDPMQVLTELITQICRPRK